MCCPALPPGENPYFKNAEYFFLYFGRLSREEGEGKILRKLRTTSTTIHHFFFFCSFFKVLFVQKSENSVFFFLSLVLAEQSLAEFILFYFLVVYAGKYSSRAHPRVVYTITKPSFSKKRISIPPLHFFLPNLYPFTSTAHNKTQVTHHTTSPIFFFFLSFFFVFFFSTKHAALQAKTLCSMLAGCIDRTVAPPHQLPF